MKIIILTIILMNLSVSYANSTPTSPRQDQTEMNIRTYEEDVSPSKVPDPKKFGDRTYSAPVDRLDEVQQEMEIDEERDLAEERAKKF